MKKILGIAITLMLVAFVPPAVAEDTPAEQPPAAEIQRFADLILYRLDMAEHVAAWKWRHSRAIEDVAQEARVLDAAALQAESSGLDFATVRPFLAAQIEASKAAQRRWFEVWKRDGMPSTQPDLELNTVLRPSIARSGDAILAQLVLVRPLLDVPNQRKHLVSILSTAAKKRSLQPEVLTQIARAASGVSYADPAASLLDRIVARGQIRIGTTGDYAPFTLKTSSGWQGIDIDLARNLAESLGVEPVFVETSWPTLMQDLKTSRYDIAMGGITKTQERQREAYQTQGYLSDGKVPLVRCGDQERLDTIKEIDSKDVRVVVNPGGTNERFVKANLSVAPVRVFPDNVRIFDEIAAGRADVMITDRIEARWQASRDPRLCTATEKTFNLTEKAYLLPRDDALLRYVDSWLERIRADGTLKAAFDKYLKPAAE
jgi:cyclohexadienyl dehydratase